MQRASKRLRLNKKFQVNGQASKISKILRDNRSWKEKARETGLENEYQFIYEYTSSLLHCTSFSIRTKPTLEKQERIMLKSLANKYTGAFLKQMYIFCNIPRNMIIIKMKES